VAQPNYVIQLSREEWDRLHAQPLLNSRGVDISGDVVNSEQDAKIRANAVAYRIEIDDYPYGDFNNIHRNYKDAIYRTANKPVNGATGWMEEYGTPEFRKEQEDLIIQSRDQLRGIQGPNNNPNGNLDLQDNTALGTTTNTLQNTRGLCMGHGHTQKEAYKYLVDMAKNPNAFGPGGGMLFVEELPGYLQAEIDNYLSANVEPPWSEQAQLFFDTTTRERGLNDGEKLEDMLKAARDNDIKVVSIDSGECSPSTVPTSAFGEQRDCNMNAFGKRAMDNAIGLYPNRKFVAFCGAAHSNTHEGGIPGFSQIYDIPAVTMNDDGTVEQDDEDRSLRGMPPKEVQVFVDQFLTEYDKEKRANRVPATEYGNDADLKADAVRMATNLFNAGKLPNPNLSNDQLRGAIRDLVAKIPKGKDQRYEGAKNAIKQGRSDDLELAVTFDPDLVMRRDQAGKTKGKNLLSLALESGAKNSTDLLRGHMETVGDRLTTNGTLDLQNMAELIVIKAENQAWNGGGNQNDSVVDVNPKKHREMVTKLTENLTKNQGKLGNQQNVVNQLGPSLANSGGFYKKGKKKIGTRDPDHVSIDKKKAAKIWVRELAAM
jgi:hypothetical protein